MAAHKRARVLQITLASADPLEVPRRSPNFFSDPYAMDLRNIMACLRTVRQLAATPPLSSITYATTHDTRHTRHTTHASDHGVLLW
jgi:choline dehydrogenase-like flavoprotein